MTRRALKPLVRRTAFDVDIGDALDRYLTESTIAASGFLDALEAACERIRRTPAIGALRYAHELNLPALRFRQCGRYPYLVFYIEEADRIHLVRVLHERRDIPSSLAEDDGSGDGVDRR